MPVYSLNASLRIDLKVAFGKLLSVLFNSFFCTVHCFSCCFRLSVKHKKKKGRNKLNNVFKYCLTLFPQPELAQRSKFLTSWLSPTCFAIFHWRVHWGYIYIYLLGYIVCSGTLDSHYSYWAPLEDNSSLWSMSRFLSTEMKSYRL